MYGYLIFGIDLFDFESAKYLTYIKKVLWVISNRYRKRLEENISRVIFYAILISVVVGRQNVGY